MLSRCIFTLIQLNDMFFRLNPITGQPLYLQLMQQIRHATETGALQDGEQLPGMVYQHIQSGMYGKYAPIDPDNPYGSGTGRRSHPGHSGYAWAATRHALDILGGLIDWSVCGANDHHMARGLLGNILDSVNRGSSPAFKLIRRTSSRSERPTTACPATPWCSSEPS